MIPPTPLYEGGEVGMLINMDESRSSWQDAIVIGFVSTVESVMVVVDDIYFFLFVMDCFLRRNDSSVIFYLDEVGKSSLTSDTSWDAVIEHLIGIACIAETNIIERSYYHRRDTEYTVPDMIGSGRFAFSCFKIGRIRTERGGDIYFFVISIHTL